MWAFGRCVKNDSSPKILSRSFAKNLFLRKQRKGDGPVTSPQRGGPGGGASPRHSHVPPSPPKARAKLFSLYTTIQIIPSKSTLASLHYSLLVGCCVIHVVSLPPTNNIYAGLRRFSVHWHHEWLTKRIDVTWHINCHQRPRSNTIPAAH